MTPVSELKDRLDKLRRTRATGALVVATGDYSTTFRSDAELAAAIADLERQIAAATGAGPIKMVRFATAKGV
jgi:hypothetical protein